MLINQSELDSVHVMIIVLAVLFPGHQGLVLDVTVFEVRLSKCVILGLGRRLLGQTFAFIFKFFTLRNLGLQNLTSCLKFVIHVAEFDSIKALFKESFGPDTFYVAYKRLFSGEKLVFTALLTPILPRHEFSVGHFLTLLLHSVLKS